MKDVVMTFSHVSQQQDIPAKPQRILVVDDNEDAAQSLSLLLQLEGYEVQVAYSGKQALTVSQELRPTIVLLDIGMPDADGYWVATQLRQQSETQDALIVAITGYGYDSDRLRSKRAGFDLHLLKPVTLHTLQSALAFDRSFDDSTTLKSPQWPERIIGATQQVTCSIGNSDAKSDEHI